MQFCCRNMQEAVRSNDIIKRDYEKYFIRGRIMVFDDGDGYFDEIENDMEIKYCPFCGKLIVI